MPLHGLGPAVRMETSLQVITGAAVGVLVHGQVIETEGDLHGTQRDDRSAAELEDRNALTLEYGTDRSLRGKEVLSELAQLHHRSVSALEFGHLSPNRSDVSR